MYKYLANPMNAALPWVCLAHTEKLQAIVELFDIGLQAYVWEVYDVHSLNFSQE